MPVRQLLGFWREYAPYLCQNGEEKPKPLAPYIPASLYDQSGQEVGAIDFLIDTGADLTAIFPSDFKSLAIDESDLVDGCPNSIGGAGGSVPIKYLEKVQLEFIELADSTFKWASDELGIICPPTEKIHEYSAIPSVLGRDFLNQCGFEFKKELIILNFNE